MNEVLSFWPWLKREVAPDKRGFLPSLFDLTGFIGLACGLCLMANFTFNINWLYFVAAILGQIFAFNITLMFTIYLYRYNGGLF